MNFQNQLEDFHNDNLNKLAERISALITSINDKKKTVEFLKNMKNQPSIEVIKRINMIACEKEDYETCDAIKDYCLEKGIEL